MAIYLEHMTYALICKNTDCYQLASAVSKKVLCVFDDTSMSEDLDPGICKFGSMLPQVKVQNYGIILGDR